MKKVILKATPPDNPTERERLEALSAYLNQYFASTGLTEDKYNVLVADTELSPPQVFDKIYLYISAGPYTSMRVDAHYFNYRQDESYDFYISADYHAKYELDIYGLDFASFDYLKKIKSLLYIADFSAVKMQVMDAEEIKNLSDTVLSDAFVGQRFKLIAHFMQNDIINVGNITSVNEIDVTGMLESVNLNVVVRRSLENDR
jgi:hypothetical protein